VFCAKGGINLEEQLNIRI